MATPTYGSSITLNAGLTLLALFCAIGSAAAQHPVTLDFDFIVGSGTQDSPGSYPEDGYTLSVPSGRVRINEFVILGTGVVFPSFGFDDQSLTLAKNGGQPFDLLSVDATEFFDTASPVTMTIRGVRNDSTVVETIITLDGSTGLQRFALSGFTSLQSVSFGGPGTGTSENIVLDNIQVEVDAIEAALAALAADVRARLAAIESKLDQLSQRTLAPGQRR